MYQPPWIRFLGFSTPPPLPWGFRLWTFDRKWATCTRSTMCSWPSKKKTARHFTSGGPGETTKVTRVLCVFSWGGNEWTIYTVVIQTEKTGGRTLLCIFWSPQTKTHVDLINEYQSPKRQNMFQHGSTSCGLIKFVSRSFLVSLFSCCCETYLSETSLQLGKESNPPDTHPGRCFLVGNLRSFWIILMPMAIGLCKWSVVVLYLIHVYMYKLL